MYARASRAKGRCDRCGFTFLLAALREEVEDGRKTGAKVCPTCFDPDHPIYKRGRINFIDPQTLRDPRPDADQPSSTSYFGWAPIGNPITRVSLSLGDLKIIVGS